MTVSAPPPTQPRPIDRRAFLAAGLAAAACAPSPGWGQTGGYPDRPVTMVVPFPAGGATDATLRILADHFQRATGQPMVIENRPGGGSLVAINYLKGRKPDGYTLGAMTRGQFASYWMAGGKNAAHPIDDFTFISSTHGSIFVLLARPDSPYRSLADVIAAARAAPEKVSVGWSGHTHRLTALELARLAGVKLLPVPFKGEGESNTALLGGQIDLGVSSGAAIPLVESGKLRTVALATDQPLARFPDWKTFTEQGVPLVADTSVGIGGPRDMDPAIVSRLDAVFAAMTRNPEFIAALAALYQPVKYLNSEEYNREVRAKFDEERRLIERYNLANP